MQEPVIALILLPAALLGVPQDAASEPPAPPSQLSHYADPVKELAAEIDAGLVKLHDVIQNAVRLDKGDEVSEEQVAAIVRETSAALLSDEKPDETREQKIERLTRSRDLLLYVINDNASTSAEKYNQSPPPPVTVDTLREAINRKESPSRPRGPGATPLADARTAMKSGDYATALRILPPIAEGGDAVAQNMLGVLYLEGWGVGQDRAKALSWFQSSAEQGDMKGAYNLGRMYDNGWGLTNDFAQAVKWYRVSAEKGYPLGQSILGAMYATGNGVAQDYAQAWLGKAAAQGSVEAQQLLTQSRSALQAGAESDSESESFAISLQKLALASSKSGRHDEAEAQARRALVIGEKHPETLLSVSLDVLAEVYVHAGRDAEAEALYRRIMDIGGNREPTLTVWHLKRCFLRQRKFAEAEKLVRSTLADDQRGRYRSDGVRSMNDLAEVLAAEGKLADAELLLRQALWIVEEAKLRRTVSPCIEDELLRLATFLLRKGDLDEAESLFTRLRVLRIEDEKRGEVDQNDRYRDAVAFGRLQLAQGRLEEAESTLEKACGRLGPPIGPFEWPECPSVLAEVRVRQGKDAEAETLYRRAFQVLDAGARDDWEFAQELASFAAVLRRLGGHDDEVRTLEERLRRVKLTG